MDRFDWLEVNNAGVKATDFASSKDTDKPFALARQMRAAGHFRAAVSYYEKAVGLEGRNYAAWREWIDTLVRARQCVRADEVSAEALSRYPDIAELYPSRALVLLHNDETQDAKRHLERAFSAGDKSWYLSSVQAEIILVETPRYSRDALDCLEKSTILAASPWEAYFIGGWMLLDANQPAWAAGYFAEAGHRNPTAPIVWLCLGDCFRELRLFDQAMFYYQKATELEPQHALALKRQRDCAPRMFGLLRVFRRDTLQSRWTKEFNQKHKTE